MHSLSLSLSPPQKNAIHSSIPFYLISEAYFATLALSLSPFPILYSPTKSAASMRGIWHRIDEGEREKGGRQKRGDKSAFTRSRANDFHISHGTLKLCGNNSHVMLSILSLYKSDKIYIESRTLQRCKERRLESKPQQLSIRISIKVNSFFCSPLLLLTLEISKKEKIRSARGEKRGHKNAEGGMQIGCPHRGTAH